MALRDKLHRYTVTAALSGLVVSLLAPILSKANCCCVSARRTADVAGLNSLIVPCCCAANVLVSSDSAPIKVCSGANLTKRTHRDCDCAMSCCTGFQPAFQSAIATPEQQPDRGNFDALIAFTSWADLGRTAPVDVGASAPPSKSLFAQDRCALLCRWLK